MKKKQFQQEIRKLDKAEMSQHNLKTSRAMLQKTIICRNKDKMN